MEDRVTELRDALENLRDELEGDELEARIAALLAEAPTEVLLALQEGQADGK